MPSGYTYVHAKAFIIFPADKRCETMVQSALWLDSIRHTNGDLQARDSTQSIWSAQKFFYIPKLFQVSLFLNGADDDAVCSLTHQAFCPLWSNSRSDCYIHAFHWTADRPHVSEHRSSHFELWAEDSDDPTGPSRRSWQPCPMVSKLIFSLQETGECVPVLTSAAGWPQVLGALDDLLSYVAKDSCTGSMSLSAITTFSIKLK